MSHREADERQAECVCGCLLNAQMTGASNGTVTYSASCELCERVLTLMVAAKAQERRKEPKR